MKSTDLKLELIKKIVNALEKHINQTSTELVGQIVFSYVLYCSSGCRDVGVACCSRSGLLQRNSKISNSNEPLWYAEVNAAEWDHINEHYDLFSEVNEFISSLYEIFYDGHLEDIALDDLDDDSLWDFISNFFVEATIQSFLILKDSGFLNHQIFESDVLVGMQFGDADQYSVDMIEKCSEKLNSSQWHKKVQQNCQLIKKNLSACK